MRSKLATAVLIRCRLASAGLSKVGDWTAELRVSRRLGSPRQGTSTEKLMDLQGLGTGGLESRQQRVQNQWKEKNGLKARRGSGGRSAVRKGDGSRDGVVREGEEWTDGGAQRGLVF